MQNGRLKYCLSAVALFAFLAPEVEQPETLHLIAAATDQGEPRLTSYQRVVLKIFPR